MGELTPEAKKELAEAIAIVREDRVDRLLRERLAPPKDDPKPDPKLDPKGDDPVPPPPKDDPTPPEPRKSGYWGEIFE